MAKMMNINSGVSSSIEDSESGASSNQTSLSSLRQ